ncbi:unnamed protein product [Phytophthora fragariaefolia]|uniref:Unnamed protein product n=1 Tax=Phytophthora fragariaefolia TaxID=1490495 RepID=A0A9W6U3D8_9STRA|nr:unnamed protein product [Phytophthora fragariaefolia]
MIDTNRFRKVGDGGYHPIPTVPGTMAERAMSAAPGRFDALLTQLAQQHGGVESLLDSFFDFLHRKTDFYVASSDPAAHQIGFLPGQAELKVLQAFRKYPIKMLDAAAAGSTKKSDEAVVAEQKTVEKQAAVAKKTQQVEPQLTDDGKQG